MPYMCKYTHKQNHAYVHVLCQPLSAHTHTCICTLLEFPPPFPNVWSLWQLLLITRTCSSSVGFDTVLPLHSHICTNLSLSSTCHIPLQLLSIYIWKDMWTYHDGILLISYMHKHVTSNTDKQAEVSMSSKQRSIMHKYMAKKINTLNHGAYHWSP